MELSQFVNSRFADDSVLGELRVQFQTAEPFPWIVLENFLTRNFVDRLVADFPQPGPDYAKYCLGDDGQIGPNYANPNPQEFPAAFRLLDSLISGDGFSSLLSKITGIPDLEYDPDYFGGGIRESQSQVFLPPHIDFNHHPRTMSHRRLNLLVYLNEDWMEEWGGAIQVHRDPRVHRKDSMIASFPPVLNRCFIFETSERSWHGFNRLVPPPGRSRRAFKVYYYTKDRPDAGAVGWHNTEYVEPPLPVRFAAGHVLTEEDELVLNEAIVRRDARIELLYRIRAEADGKYAHVWKEYEYYLDLSRTLRRELDGLTAAAAHGGDNAPVDPRQAARGSSAIRAIRALRDRVIPGRPSWRRSPGR
jgi:2-oxoglutarate-Fe(II)-dependent oxygenase superfamily protein